MSSIVTTIQVHNTLHRRVFLSLAFYLDKPSNARTQNISGFIKESVVQASAFGPSGVSGFIRVRMPILHVSD